MFNAIQFRTYPRGKVVIMYAVSQKQKSVKTVKNFSNVARSYSEMFSVRTHSNWRV